MYERKYCIFVCFKKYEYKVNPRGLLKNENNIKTVCSCLQIQIGVHDNGPPWYRHFVTLEHVYNSKCGKFTSDLSFGIFVISLKGALDNIFQFSFWLNFIYQIKIYS